MGSGDHARRPRGGHDDVGLPGVLGQGRCERLMARRAQRVVGGRQFEVTIDVRQVRVVAVRAGEAALQEIGTHSALEVQSRADLGVAVFLLRLETKGRQRGGVPLP